MRDKFLDIWPIWNIVLARESRLAFILSMGAVAIFIGGPMYLITNHLMALRGTTVFDPTTSLDLAIPFMAWTIVIYQSLFYFFYPLPLISVPNNQRGRYEALIMSQGLLVIILVSNIWFVICPAEVHLRSEAIQNIDSMHPIFQTMFEGLWLMDSPYNSWPSLHVSSAGIFALFAIRWWKDKPIRQWAVGIWWVLMSLSILTTKQHFLLDLVTALMLLGAVWKWQIQPSLEKLDTKSIDESTS
ncbi:MAG: phosphatase PAP2 family protein [Candidatus Poseidoniales archaeon]|nr:phosphatase PAP2 family protein [Candidatus Poseidoniales archaeon]